MLRVDSSDIPVVDVKHPSNVSGTSEALEAPKRLAATITIPDMDFMVVFVCIEGRCFEIDV